MEKTGMVFFKKTIWFKPWFKPNNPNSLLKAFLGPTKSNKFLIQDKDACVTRCPLYTLQNCHLQDPASILMEETLFAHHELHGCSTLSLMAMWYFWDKEFRIALEEGCRMQDIIKYSQIFLELAISALSDMKVSLGKMLVFKKQCPKKNPFQKVKDLSQKSLSIQYTSRHFSPSQSTLNSECQSDQISEIDEKCLKDVVRSLNHDDDLKINELIVECWKKQMTSTNCTKFQREGLLVCPSVSPCCHSIAVDGLVVKSNLNHTWYQNKKNGDTNRTLIIMGSITYKYVHLGFAPKVNISVQASNIPVITKEEEWRKTCCDLLMQLNINVLVSKDEIDHKIADFCCSHDILVFPHMPLKCFKIICKALKYSPCFYLSDCKEENIIHNLIVKEWKPSEHSDGHDPYFLFQVSLKNTLPLQTIIIGHPSLSVLQMLEHQTQHLISRLSVASQNDSLLPGGGEVEKKCIDFLRKQLQFQKPSESTFKVASALINGYENYRCLVITKKDLLSNNMFQIMDEMFSKVNAWHSALSLVLLTLQCDTVLVNGAAGDV